MNAAELPELNDYQAFFEASPELLFIMRVAPGFPIVAASDNFLRGTMTNRETMLGRGLFDVFPAAPGSQMVTSKEDILAVMDRVCRAGQLELVPPYRFDLPRPEAEGGGLEERHWQMSLTPIGRAGDGQPRFVLARSIDITAQVFSEREIKDTRSRLEATLAAAEIGTWIWEVEGNRVFADRNLARLFNVSDADANGGALEHYLANIHEEDRVRVAQDIGQSMERGVSFDTEYRVLRPDGGYRWVAARGWGERDPLTGTAVRFPGVVLDITARRQAEDSARANAENLRLALASANLGTWEFNPVTGALNWSDTTRAMFGMSPGEPVDYEHAFLGGLHPEDRERTAQAVQEVLAPGSDGVFAAEFRTIGAEDKIERWMSSLGKAFFNENGECRRFIGTLLDITARKRGEQAAERRSEQLRRLAETSARLNATLDVASLLGVITVEARNLIGARHAVTTAAPAGPLQVGVQPLTVASHAEDALPLVSAPGAVQSAALSVPLIGQSGARLGVIELTSKEAGGFTPDDAALLTQLSQIAARAIENARLYEELRSNDKRKDEFLAMLAHELRNPLAAMRNAVALGSDTNDATDVSWAMEVIQRQIKQLSRMIDDLLDVSRITQGMIQLRRETIDAAHLFGRATDTVSGLIGERGHTLQIDAPPGRFFLDGDAVRLEQVLVNLLTNAAKYTDKGGEITLSAAQDGDFIVLTVRDNGSGIPPEKLPQMFELFAQGNRTLARSEGGLGIGLTVVRSLTELHGGSVHATSGGPGQGSAFSVRFPAVKVVGESPVGTPVPADVPKADRKVRVLVVDDNEDSARAVARIISRQGYDVKVAYDGPTAVETALEHQPVFVFLDIGLPGMNGYEVAMRLRKEDTLKDALLVAVSGYGEEGDRRRSREAGFDQHLVKPVDPETLLALMRS